MGKYQEASARTFPGVMEDDYVYVDDSDYLESLNINGKGLYAARKYNAGDVIIEYLGRIITDEEAEKKRRSTQYMVDVKENGKVIHVIDGGNKKYSSAGRYANTTKTWKDRKRNAELVQYKQKIYLVASKTIRKDKEILLFYGPETNRIINSR